MASKIVEAVRNSPLVGRKGGYSPITTHNSDPFVQGIPFHAYHLATVDVPDRVGTDKVQTTISMALDEVQKAKKQPPKVTLVIKAVSITVRSSPKSEIVYPIYLISYCGNAKDTDVIFFFIFKSKADDKIRAEVFKCSSDEKVLAITRTVSKAFNIAYKAWQTKKRQDQRTYSPKSSPLLQQKTAKDKEDLGKSLAQKAAAGVSYYTPPIPRKSPEKEEQRPRSGSLDDDEDVSKIASTLKHAALEKVKIKNEASGMPFAHQ